MSDPSTADPVEFDDDEGDDDALVAAEVLWTSDDALTFGEARRLTSRRGATVVLFAGDNEAGKTTAMVEIWTSLLLAGTLGGAVIAGSNNALAFELRSFTSRVESGANFTVRTNPDTEGFLHLGVDSPRGRVEILFADYAGEHFTRIREGTEVADELPWIGRVDRLAVFVDGAFVASPAFAEVAFTRAQRLLWKLRDCTERGPKMRAALVLTKAELVTEARLADLETSLRDLHALACELDPEAPLLHISARPTKGTAPEGLDDLLDWICADDLFAAVREPVLVRPERAMGRYG